jgi:hypothetical protein
MAPRDLPVPNNDGDRDVGDIPAGVHDGDPVE